MSARNISWGVKVTGEGLTNVPPSCADCLEFWELQPLGTIRACPGLYRDSFACKMWTVIFTIITFISVLLEIIGSTLCIKEYQMLAFTNEKSGSNKSTIA